MKNRKSPRLQGYDYAQMGAYFVTICTHQRAHLFGAVYHGEVNLSAVGDLASTSWQAIPAHYAHVELDVFIVMPDHIHGIIILSDSDTKTKHSLGMVMGGYKSSVTRQARHVLNEPDLCVWQERYYDHIIRDTHDLDRIRAYIVENPARWRQSE